MGEVLDVVWKRPSDWSIIEPVVAIDIFVQCILTGEGDGWGRYLMFYGKDHQIGLSLKGSTFLSFKWTFVIAN